MKFRRPMRLRSLAGLVLGASMLSVQAQPSDAYRAITAKELLAGFMEGGLASWLEDPVQRASLSTFIATAYVLGVADSVSGSAWCPGDQMQTPAMLEPVLDYLADVPQDRQNDRAAKIVAQALSKAYPCVPVIGQ